MNDIRDVYPSCKIYANSLQCAILCGEVVGQNTGSPGDLGKAVISHCTVAFRVKALRHWLPQ